MKIGQLTKFNYVDQGRLQLNEERTVLDEASDGTEFVIWGEARISVRSYLRRFLFADDRINTLVKKLSGGERCRVLLAKILKCGGNFLILDEPTNNLDLPTLRVLEEALIAFPGVVCVDEVASNFRQDEAVNWNVSIERSLGSNMSIHAAT